MDGAASTLAYDDDGLRIPTDTKARAGGSKKKDAPARHLSQACQQSAEPSLIGWPDRRQAIVRTVEALLVNHPNLFCQSSASQGRRNLMIIPAPIDSSIQAHSSVQLGHDRQSNSPTGRYLSPIQL